MPIFPYEPSYIVRKRGKSFEVLTVNSRNFGWHPAEETLPVPIHNPNHAKSHLRRFLDSPEREPNAKHMTSRKRSFIAAIGNPPPPNVRIVRVDDLLRLYPEHEPRLRSALDRFQAKRARKKQNSELVW